MHEQTRNHGGDAACRTTSPELTTVRGRSPALADAIERVVAVETAYAETALRTLARGGSRMLIARVDAQHARARELLRAWAHDPGREREAIAAHLLVAAAMEDLVLSDARRATP